LYPIPLFSSFAPLYPVLCKYLGIGKFPVSSTIFSASKIEQHKFDFFALAT
jgi:hypothetical protein